MKVKYLMVTGASGSAGGITAARNRGGSYWRARVSPVNPSSERQEAVRVAMSDWSASWRSLTDQQRADWTAYAETINATDSLGNQYKVAGNSAYCGINVLRSQWGGLGGITTAPTTPGRPTLSVPQTIAYNTSNDELTVDIVLANGWAAASGGVFAIYRGPAVSLGVNYYKGPYRYWNHVVRGGSPPADPLVIDMSMAVPYGAPQAGQKVPYRIITQSADGRTSRSIYGFITDIT